MPGFSPHDLLGLAPGADHRAVEARIASLRRALQGRWPCRLRLWLVGVDATLLDRAAAALADAPAIEASGQAPPATGRPPLPHCPWL